jgi:hypothetical protein
MSVSEKHSIEEEWTQLARKVLVRKTIVRVEYMGDERARELDWYSRPIVLILNDGTRVYPSMDDEGNDGGALFYENGSGQRVLPVLR